MNKIERLILPDFKIYYKAIVNKKSGSSARIDK